MYRVHIVAPGFSANEAVVVAWGSGEAAPGRAKRGGGRDKYEVPIHRRLYGISQERDTLARFSVRYYLMC
jgi:hypothetical protein